ncbi:MAG: hypothetical protein NC212_10285 [Staphylococcus sp.]|nr:hypothetical protein [Staphylococcus sp.]
MDNNISTLSDKFSLKRVMAFGAMFGSSMKIYLILTFCISLCSYLCVQFCMHHTRHVLPFYTLFSSLVGMSLYLSPLVFARRDDNLIAQIPAKVSEKFCCYVVFSLVIAPLVIEAGWYGTNIIFSLFGDKYDLTIYMYNLAEKAIDTSTFPSKNLFFVYSIIQSVATIMGVLYIVITSSTHRVIKGILALAGLIFLVGLIAAISGFVVAFREISNESLGASINETSLNETRTNLLIALSPVFYCLYGFLIAFDIFVMYLLYRHIGRQQVRA